MAKSTPKTPRAVKASKAEMDTTAARTGKTVRSGAGKTTEKGKTTEPRRTPRARPTTPRTTRTRTSRTVAESVDSGMAPGSLPETAAPVNAAEPTHDEIAARAYFVHLRRDGAPGHPDDDWLVALAELRRERGLL